MTHKDTKHGEKRVAQRGFIRRDLELIRRCGTLLEDRSAEVYLLRDKDVENGIRDLKHQIQSLERMRGCKAVFAPGDTLITVHHTTRRHEKKLLHRAG